MCDVKPAEEEDDDRDVLVMLEAGLKLLCFNKLSIRSRIVFNLSTCSCLSDICFISHSRTSAACLISSSEKLDIPCLIWRKRYIVFSERQFSMLFHKRLLLKTLMNH